MSSLPRHNPARNWKQSDLKEGGKGTEKMVSMIELREC